MADHDRPAGERAGETVSDFQRQTGVERVVDGFQIGAAGVGWCARGGESQSVSAIITSAVAEFLGASLGNV
jgi:hypothetical protein